MKKISLIVLIVTVLFAAGLTAQSFWGGKTMSARNVSIKWGKEKIDFKKFKEGSFETKAKMAFSIMTDKSLIGKSAAYIRENFGDHDGFYFIDTYPAYIIQSGKNHQEETWQIVFKLNSKYVVRDIIVHKNCCDQ